MLYYDAFGRAHYPRMVQVTRFWQENLSRWRASLFAIVVGLAFFNAGCASLVKVRDNSIPKLLTPVTDAKFNDLLSQLQPFTDLQALRASQVYIQFIDAESSEKFRYEADSILLLNRPDKIRLLIQAPGIKTKISDMVSESNQFKVGIYYPSEYRRFLLGTNDADYSMWRARLAEKERRSGLTSARPFHFTEALMMRPVQLRDARFAYALEESLQEEADTRPGAKKGARVLRSFYVISEVELGNGEQGPALVRRRFWFDRTNGAKFARQQIFDAQGNLTSEVTYSDFKKLRADSPDLWPGVVLVHRPHDGYSARLTFTEEKFELNPTLPPNAFVLANTDNLPETDLDKDKPVKP